MVPQSHLLNLEAIPNIVTQAIRRRNRATREQWEPNTRKVSSIQFFQLFLLNIIFIFLHSLFSLLLSYRTGSQHNTY